MSLTGILAILTAQHLNDMCEACECPRCCLPCRAAREVIHANGFAWEVTFEELGIEGYWWQTEYGSFAVDRIEAAWHDECPAYATIEVYVEEDAGADEERDEDGDGEPAGGVETPEVSEA